MRRFVSRAVLKMLQYEMNLLTFDALRNDKEYVKVVLPLCALYLATPRIINQIKKIISIPAT